METKTENSAITRKERYGETAQIRVNAGTDLQSGKAIMFVIGIPAPLSLSCAVAEAARSGSESWSPVILLLSDHKSPDIQDLPDDNQGAQGHHDRHQR
jgi:hypothetical protein